MEEYRSVVLMKRKPAGDEVSIIRRHHNNREYVERIVLRPCLFVIKIMFYFRNHSSKHKIFLIIAWRIPIVDFYCENIYSAIISLLHNENSFMFQIFETL